MRRSHGFTLIEVLVVLTVLGIMLGVGIPSFKNFIAQQRVKSTAYEIATSLLIARSEAIKRNASVTVTPVTGSDWTSGWKVAVGATTLQTQSSVTGITVNTTKAPTSITFQGTGRPTAGTVSYWEVASSVTTSITGRCVRLDTAGVSSTSSGTCP